eukprot:UN10261
MKSDSRPSSKIQTFMYVEKKLHDIVFKDHTPESRKRMLENFAKTYDKK